MRLKISWFALAWLTNGTVTKARFDNRILLYVRAIVGRMLVSKRNKVRKYKGFPQVPKMKVENLMEIMSTSIPNAAILSGVSFIMITSLNGTTQAQSISGIMIGDPISKVKNIGLEPVAKNRTGPFAMMKWVFPDKNELSITAQVSTGRIVFIESDWGGRSQGSFADFPRFLYGKTTLSQIRERFGSNGMTFSERGPIAEVSDGLIALNAFEVGPVIVTFVTKVAAKDTPALASHKKGLGDLALLDSISLADPEYAEIA